MEVNMYKDGPDVLDVFWEPQVFYSCIFWVHLGDKARTEGFLEEIEAVVRHDKSQSLERSLWQLLQKTLIKELRLEAMWLGAIVVVIQKRNDEGLNEGVDNENYEKM